MDADHSFRFEAVELELCPVCGERELVPRSPNALLRLCLNCGVLPTTITPTPKPLPSQGAV
jgi:hypothetical protein